MLSTNAHLGAFCVSGGFHQKIRANLLSVEKITGVDGSFDASVK
jgi:hypothetical protein